MNPVPKSLDEVADIQVGFAFSSSEFTKERKGYRLLRNDNLAHGQTRWLNGVYLNPTEEPDERYKLRPNDVVVAMDRPWIASGLKYAIVQRDDLPALLVQRVARLRARLGVDERYLGYLVGGTAFAEYVQAVQTGTTIPHVSAHQLGSFRFDKRSLDEQIAVGGLLGALDDKIAANVQITRTADDLSQTYFDRVRLDADKRPFTSLASFTNGKAFTKGASGTGRVVVRIAELNSGIGPSTVRSNAIVAEQHIARPGDILFAWSGSLTLCRWYRRDAIVNQHIFKVEPTDGAPRWLIFQALLAELAEFRAIAADKATTMGHIQRHHLDRPAAVPDHGQVKAMDSLMTALWDRALAAEQESIGLAELRDTLLPHLMSGRLTVRDAERTVSDAV